MSLHELLAILLSCLHSFGALKKVKVQDLPMFVLLSIVVPLFLLLLLLGWPDNIFFVQGRRPEEGGVWNAID